jgi:hypothetical protein
MCLLHDTDTTATHWGIPHGSLFYRTLLLRGKTLWSSPSNHRIDMRPIAKFKARRKSVWGLRIDGFSSCGSFSVDFCAGDSSSHGRRFWGVVKANSQEIAHLTCDGQDTDLVSVDSHDNTINLTLGKTHPSRFESDVILKEARIGELAIIERWPTERLSDQVKILTSFGVYRAGQFKETNQLGHNIRLTQATLATLCLYFYWLEPLMNTDYPGG